MKKFLIGVVLGLVGLNTSAIDVGYTPNEVTSAPYLSKDFKLIGENPNVNIYVSGNNSYQIQTDDENDLIAVAPFRYDLKTDLGGDQSGDMYVQFLYVDCIRKLNSSAFILVFDKSGKLKREEIGTNEWEYTEVGSNGRLFNNVICYGNLTHGAD